MRMIVLISHDQLQAGRRSYKVRTATRRAPAWLMTSLLSHLYRASPRKALARLLS